MSVEPAVLGAILWLCFASYILYKVFNFRRFIQIFMKKQPFLQELNFDYAIRSIDAILAIVFLIAPMFMFAWICRGFVDIFINVLWVQAWEKATKSNDITNLISLFQLMATTSLSAIIGLTTVYIASQQLRIAESKYHLDRLTSTVDALQNILNKKFIIRNPNDTIDYPDEPSA